METIPAHPSGNPDLLASPGKHSVSPSVEIPTKSLKTSDSNGVGRATRASSEGTKASNMSSGRLKSSVTKPAVGSDAMTKRRNSTGGLSQKLTISAQKRLETTSTFGGRKVVAPVVEPGKRSGLESKRTLSTSTKSSVEESKDRLSRSSSRLDNKMGSERKLPVKSSLTSSVSKKLSMSPSSSNGRSTSRMTTTNISSPSTHSPSVTSSLKTRSLSSSGGKGSGPLGRGKVSTPDNRDSRLIMLPQIEVKAGDDLRMDLRGHRVHSLTARGLKLSPNLEFLYLRDNLLSSLEGIETLKRVKVLDLSFNDFKGPGFEPLENCKALQQLYLAGNHITSLASLPELPNLEFLSVAQNRLKSLRMASQPRLQVLAASKNRIYTLKGFPHFPVLEHLRVEENPILDMPHIEAASTLLVGPTLKKFNDRDLSPQELEYAAQYPAHTALCIRDGWEFCQPDLASESTFSFLLERWKDHLPPGFILKEASVDKPFEEDACYSHFVFSSDGGQNNESELTLRYQWFIGDNISTQFSSIRDASSEVYWPKHEDVGKFLKVECTPIFEGMAYPSIFAVSAVVSRGTGCPKILNLEVDGILVEGNVIKGCAKVAWCGGTPGKGVSSWLRRKWNSSSEVIAGAEDQEYRLTIDDIGSSLVYMYTAVTEEGVKGGPQYAMTDFVKPASPTVHNVKIIGDAVEGNTIRGVGEYFGGKEGPSKFEWSRQNRETGDLILVCDGTTDYTLTKEDIGWRMAFAYIPTNFEGQEGMAVSAVTETVRKAPPQASSLVLVGDVKEGSKVAVTASVVNGTEGSSRVQWFKSNSSLLDDESSLEAVSASKVAKAFRIPLGVVGYYLVAKFTPMAPDGESGEPAFVISQKPVETLPPSLNFLSVTGDYVEGEMLTASYGYIGGHEGKSLYAWYLHENEIDRGTLIQEASGLLQYRITKKSMDKFISFQCTPIRDDGVVGEPSIYRASERVRPGSPRLLSLKIFGDAAEGTKLFADKKYWGGEEGNSVFHWFLTSNDGKMSEIKGATGVYYILQYEDIGFMVSVSCEPVRNDGARGPVVISDPVGPVSPGLPVCKSLDICGSLMEGERLTFTAAYAGGEKGNCLHEWFRVKRNRFRERLTNCDYLDLTLLDVGMCIELVYTPIRKDGLRGPSVSCVSTIICPADPKGIQLMIPDCYEDQEVVPQKSYYGGEEGSGEYTWYRTTRKLDEMELLKISDKCENAVVVGKHLTYAPSLEDVDSYLILYWVPTRADGKRGIPVVAISSPVLPAFPNVSNVYVKELSISTYAGEGIYYGGHEGSSLYSWYRETHEGTITLISGADSMTYDVTDLDYNCRLIFGYTPVRSDSVVGEQRLSEHTNIILPEFPRIEMLSFTGKPIEGEALKAVEVIPNVCSKYKKEAIYQWSYSTVEDFQSFEILPSQCSGSYKLRLEDIGRFLKCECFVMDVFGRSSEVASAVTGPISPGIPKIDKLEIEGRGYHTNLYAVRGSYSGGKEGKSKIQWLRSMAGSPDLISISGEVGRMYEANVDDVGYRLVVVYTPVREDGEEGQAVSAATETISVEPDVYKEVKQKIDLGLVKFEVLCDKEPAQKKVNGAANLERRILEVNKKRVKVIKPGSKASFPATEIRGTYAPPFHVELYRSDQHRFKIVVDGENEVELMVQTRYMRDIIVLVIRGFAQRFNSTSLNSLLKIES